MKIFTSTTIFISSTNHAAKKKSISPRTLEDIPRDTDLNPRKKSELQLDLKIPSLDLNIPSLDLKIPSFELQIKQDLYV